MSLLHILEILYLLILFLVCIRIIYDTRNNTKTLAYLLFAIFAPFIGMAFYFLFGINYRNRKMYSKKLINNHTIAAKLKGYIHQYSLETFNQSDATVKNYKELANMLLKESTSPLTSDNEVTLLLNGENKFPELIRALKAAKQHIHIEYYIVEDDETGKEIESVLIQKAGEGVQVRFIYDDYGSRSIRKTLVPRLRNAGIKAYPFFKVRFITLANRLNYRNHRKIVVIDGKTGFLGGINISDRYVNTIERANKVFWRDTHLRLDGPSVQYLQYLFLCDWNFCADAPLEPDNLLFPPLNSIPKLGNKIVQIAASGPDSETPIILYSIIQAINLASKEILISTPYFVPNESLLDALRIASLGGLKIKIILPLKSDSSIVDLAVQSYYNELLSVGIEIYRYQKGFMHAKTIVFDGQLAMVGTSNMDIRSFDLNFEVNAIVYDKEIAEKLQETFYDDLKDSIRVDTLDWGNRTAIRKLTEKAFRLISPLL
jgi:cardiolipin synthase